MALPGAKEQTRDIGGEKGGQFAKTKGSDFKKFKGARKKLKEWTSEAVAGYNPAPTNYKAYLTKANAVSVGSKYEITDIVTPPPNVKQVFARKDPDDLMVDKPDYHHIWAIDTDGQTFPVGQYTNKISDINTIETDLWDEAKARADAKVYAGEAEGASTPEAAKKEPEAPQPSEPVSVGLSGAPIPPPGGGGKKAKLTNSQRKHIVALRDAGDAGVVPATNQAKAPYEYFVKQGLAEKDGDVYRITDAGKLRAEDVSPSQAAAAGPSLGEELDAMVKDQPSGEVGVVTDVLTPDEIRQALAVVDTAIIDFPEDEEDYSFNEKLQTLYQDLQDGNKSWTDIDGGLLNAVLTDYKSDILDEPESYDPDELPTIDSIQEKILGTTTTAEPTVTGGFANEFGEIRLTGDQGANAASYFEDEFGDEDPDEAAIAYHIAKGEYGLLTPAQKALALQTLEAEAPGDPDLYPVIEALKGTDVEGVAATANAPTPSGFPDFNDLTVTGNAPGTTGPKFVTDKNGNKYVMKTGEGGAGVTSIAHLESEMLADSLYQAMGADVPDFHRYVDPATGKPVKVSKFVESQGTWNDIANSGTPEDRAAFKAALQDKFAVDAFMGTWDVIGVGNENPAANVLWDGKKAWRIDNGGALTFKGMGGQKGESFKDEVGELDTMRKSSAPINKEIFGDLSDAQVAEQIKRDFTEEKFDELFAVDGPFVGDNQLKAKMEKRWHSTVAWGKAHEAPAPTSAPTPGDNADADASLSPGDTNSLGLIVSPGLRDAIRTRWV